MDSLTDDVNRLALRSGRLYTLPIEIRQSIYELYYRGSSERVIYFAHNGHHGRCIVRVNDETAPHTCGSRGQSFLDLVKPQQNLLHLPLASRQIYRESMPILYSQVALRFLSADALTAFSAMVPAQYFADVAALTLEAPGYSLLEDYFDKFQWRRVWRIVAGLRRLKYLTVNMLDSERSLSRHNWAEVLDPMMEATVPEIFNVRLHCEPDILPVIDAAAPFTISWLDEDGSNWHPNDQSVEERQSALDIL